MILREIQPAGDKHPFPVPPAFERGLHWRLWAHPDPTPSCGASVWTHPDPFLYSAGSFCRYTLIPTSILLGLGAAPLWASQCTYITIVGNLQAKKEKKLGKDVVNQYFGVFFLVFQSSGVCGNLISSLVFSQTPTHGKE